MCFGTPAFCAQHTRRISLIAEIVMDKFAKMRLFATIMDVWPRTCFITNKEAWSNGMQGPFEGLQTTFGLAGSLPSLQEAPSGNMKCLRPTVKVEAKKL